MKSTEPTLKDPAHGDAAAGRPATDSNIVPIAVPPSERRPSAKVVAFVKRHPLVVVAGGVALGALASTLLPRKTGRRVAGKAMDWAEAAGAATMLAGRRAGHSARTVADEAEKGGNLAVLKLEKYGLAALAAASALGKATARRASVIGDAAARKAGEFGDAAADRSHQVANLAHRMKDRIGHGG